MDRNHSLIFFGSFGEYSRDFLREISVKYAVNAVVTSPPKPAGRHLKLTKTLVHEYALSQNIPVHHNFENLPPSDFILVAGYGKLIPENIIRLPKIMAINFHPSLLPYYSGSTPVEFALLNGETETGITYIKISPQFDTGDILYQEKIAILPEDNRLTLYKKLFSLGVKKTLDLLPQIAIGNFTLTPQPHIPDAIKSRKLTKQDGYVEYSQLKNQNIESKIKAFAGWPGVWTIDPHGQRIILSSSPRKS